MLYLFSYKINIEIFFGIFQHENIYTTEKCDLDTLPLHILQQICMFVIGHSITEISVLRKISNTFKYVIQTIENKLPRIYFNPSVLDILRNSKWNNQNSEEMNIPISFLCDICGRYSGLMISIRTLLNNNQNRFKTYKLHVKKINQFGWYRIINVNK